MTNKRGNGSGLAEHSKKTKSGDESQQIVHKSLVWFRSDLRLKDNPALSQATCYSGTPDGVIAVYIVSEKDWTRHDWGSVKVDFIRRNLHDLREKLRSDLNIPLFVLSIESFERVPVELASFCRSHCVSAVWFNNEIEWDELQRDDKVEQELSQAQILCRRFHDQCVVEAGRVLTKESKPYTIFTPFKNSWLAHLEANPPKIESDPTKQSESSTNVIGSSVQDIDLLFNSLPAELAEIESGLLKTVGRDWPAGEEHAQSRLDDFAKFQIRDYKTSRDFPYLKNGTSSLSAYLSLGIVSSKICVLRARVENHGNISSGSEGITTWISELCWRDFYRHIMYHFPRVSRGKPFRLATERVEWRYPQEDAKAASDFENWCRGSTGYPIVDAAMRFLNSNGWMHNRLRMIVSMFLAKDLLIDWRCGEKFFMRKLIDGDFPSNNGGWQWSASTGTDSQPYFRVFNPSLQSVRFDPNGEFIRLWVPELKDLSNKQIHEPSRHISAAKLKSIGYCEPIVDHSKARLKAIEAFKKVFSK